MKYVLCVNNDKDVISANLAEEDKVYSVLLITISIIVEFSKHLYIHICICNTVTDFATKKKNPNVNIFEFTKFK
jgi:hypothetical protein